MFKWYWFICDMFSIIPEVASCSLQFSSRNHYHLWFLWWTVLTQEWNEHCHPLIVDNLEWCGQVTGQHEAPHLFSDIEALNPSYTTTPGMNYEMKKKAIMTSWLQPSQFCHTCHDELCHVPSADFGVSGLPCEDMSIAGNRLKREGKTNGVYLTHAKYNKIHRTPLLLLECTPDSWLG